MNLRQDFVQVRKHPVISGLMLIGLVAVCYGVAQFGAGVTTPVTSDSGGWYANLEKSALNPPNWTFAVVWTLLYGLMAIAAWRTWAKSPTFLKAAPALAAFFAQLGLNALWSQVFFAHKNPGWALVVSVALLAAIAGTAWLFHKTDRIAGWLMAPYLAWVVFATYLNATIVALNG